MKFTDPDYFAHLHTLSVADLEREYDVLRSLRRWAVAQGRVDYRVIRQWSQIECAKSRASAKDIIRARRALAQRARYGMWVIEHVLGRRPHRSNLA